MPAKREAKYGGEGTYVNKNNARSTDLRFGNERVDVDVALRSAADADVAGRGQRMTVRISSYDLSEDELKEVFRKIANNERKHGGFLTAFAQAFIAADPSNAGILRDVARQIADKYEITHYGREPQSVESPA